MRSFPYLPILVLSPSAPSFFFFNDTPTTEIYTLSLHDALPIYQRSADPPHRRRADRARDLDRGRHRSEEHTSELQSLTNLVCRLLLEKKKNKNKHIRRSRAKLI